MKEKMVRKSLPKSKDHVHIANDKIKHIEKKSLS